MIFGDDLNFDDLARFCRLLLRYNKAGIPAQMCIEMYAQNTQKEKLKNICEIMIDDMKNGDSLAAAMRKHSFFPKYVVEMISIGEDTGQLEKFLDRIVFFIETQSDVKKKINSAVTQAGLISFVLFIAFIIAVFFVIPKIGEVLVSMHAQLPFFSQMVINIGSLLGNHIFIVGIAVILFLLAVSYIRRTFPVKWSATMLRLPILGVIFKTEIICSFYEIVSLCASAGIKTTKAFQYAAMAIDHAQLQQILNKSVDFMENEGLTPILALEKADGSAIFPSDTSLIFQAADQSGQMADIFDGEAEEMQKSLLLLSKEVGEKLNTSVVIPSVLIMIGLLGAVYFPIFQLMSVAKNMG